MAYIALKWFAGMVPRMGNQHLKPPHATEAENCNLYSGELRPLNRPALAHKFCVPGDTCFITPKPEDPSIPPEPPPEPPQCVSVVIVTQPTAGDLSLVEGGTPLTLSVIVNSDATVPVQYQWLQDNQALPGEVGPVFDTVLQPSDSFTSFTVFVQNPCGEEISLPVVVGEVIDQPFCKIYECDALTTAILSIGPDAYYPMRNGLADTDGSVDSGNYLLDAVGSADLQFSYGPIYTVWPDAAGLLDNCPPDTCFESSGATLRSQNPQPTYSMAGNGTLFCVWKDGRQSGTGGGSWGLTWTQGSPGWESMYIGARSFTYQTRRADNSGVSNSRPLTMSPVPGTIDTLFTLVTWRSITAGTETEIFVYDATGTQIWTEIVEGQIGADATGGSGVDVEYVNMGFYDNKWQDCTYKAAYIDAATVGQLIEGLNQNLVGYVDPNPNCRMPA